MKRPRRQKRNDNESDEEDEGCEVVCDNDCVYFYAPVTTSNTVKLLQAMREAGNYALQKCVWPEDARIYLYIHSGGGDAFAGLSAMDHIRLSRVPVVTIADGFVASAATFMLLGGSERKAFRSAKILIHQMSTSFLGKYQDLLDEVHNSTDLMETMKQVYAENTAMNKDEIDRLLTKELQLNAKQAIKKGVVDEIW